MGSTKHAADVLKVDARRERELGKDARDRLGLCGAPMELGFDGLIGSMEMRRVGTGESKAVFLCAIEVAKDSHAMFPLLYSG